MSELHFASCLLLLNTFGLASSNDPISALLSFRFSKTVTLLIHRNFSHFLTRSDVHDLLHLKKVVARPETGPEGANFLPLTKLVEVME